MTGVFSLN